jgi:Fic family protein
VNELQSLLQKCDALSQKIGQFRPLLPEELTPLRQYFKIGLTYTSNALEGNSLTETETKIVLEDGLTMAGKPMKDHLEAVGHGRAYDQLFTLAKEKAVSTNDMLDLHRYLMENLDPETAGRYRNVKVFVSGSKTVFPLPDDVPHHIAELFRNFEVWAQSHHPIVAVAKLHYNIVAIHPFTDGNGRTARLLMNLFLMQHHYPIILIPFVRRSEYLEALHEADLGQEDCFYAFIASCVYESQKDYVRLLGEAA